MTTQEKDWFEALVKDREENARILAKDSMVGYRQSPIDKYSDCAHFVYEFLQNADDVKASKCVFLLDNNGLLFKHNGTAPFSVSDPRNEAVDRKSGQLGSVNAITAAGLSTKSGNEIGRFGIGFKAVFQYTDNPRIYDDNISFGLRNEIVPYLLEVGLEERKMGETCFIIPFRTAEKDRAYKEINEKIIAITYPLLFLSNLKEISFLSSKLVGGYNKEVYDRKIYNCKDGTSVELEFVILKRVLGLEETETRFLKFSKESEEGKVSVVFGIDNGNSSIRLVPLQAPVFCFFPTKMDTELAFLIHAPFLLNDSREGIKVGQPHNEKLILTLAMLAIQAVELMESKLPSEIHNWFGIQRQGIKLVDDGILDFVPLNLKEQQDRVSFSPFAAAFMVTFLTESVIPCQEGNSRELCYRKKDVACWSSDNSLIQLLTSDQLALLMGRQPLYWGFASVHDTSSEKRTFIKACCGNIIEWASIRPMLTAAFFERQPIAWFEGFFNYIMRDSWNINSYKTVPMFLDKHRKAVAAFDEAGNHILYLPSDDLSSDSLLSSRTINPEFMRFSSVKQIIELWEIGIESKLSVVKHIIREELVNGDDCTYAKCFRDVLEYCGSCSDDDLNKVGEVFKKYPALMVYNPSDNRKWKAKSNECYYSTEELLLYFEGRNMVSFVDMPYLKEVAGHENHVALEKLLSVLGVWKYPRYFTELRRKSIDMLYGETWNWHFSYRQAYEKWDEFYIEGFKPYFERFLSVTDYDLKKRMSVVLWNFLCEIICQVVTGHSHIEDKMRGEHHFYYNHAWQVEEYETVLCGLLKRNTWLFDDRGEFRQHHDLSVEALDKLYDVSSNQARQLLEFLGIKHDERMMALNILSDEERLDLSVAKDIRAAGFGSLAEAKNILENLPDKVRRKISTGELTATKMLSAVNLLEQSEAMCSNPGLQGIKENPSQLMKTIGQDVDGRMIDGNVGTIMSVAVADGQYAGLSKDAQANALKEAKELVRAELEQRGYEFTNGICEDQYSIIDGVQKHGVDYPLVVHSYLDDSRQFQLSASDWAQLMKPNSMLWVRTRKGVFSIPFRELVCNRERIELSFSTENLDISDRIGALASVMRWFKGLKFDFGTLAPVNVGAVQTFDLPENEILEEKREAELAPDPVSEVF